MSANKMKGEDAMETDGRLDDRKVKILKAVIQNYLDTGEPVGSRTISKLTDLQLSSATIRNEMADARDLKSLGGNIVPVRSRSAALAEPYRIFR